MSKEYTLTAKVSAKGAVSVYGLRKWPVTFYKDEWRALLAKGQRIEEFIQAHEDELSEKSDAQSEDTSKATL